MRREQPFVKAGAVIIAIEIFVLKCEMGIGMGAVYNHGNSFFTRHLHHFFDRHDLAGDIDDVAHENHARARSNIFLEETNDLVRVFRRHGQGKLNELDTVTTFALFERSNHAPVVVGRRQHFIAGFQVDTELADLEAF